MNEETLFQEALSRSPEERASFLEQACAGRPQLRAAVEALLAAHGKSGNVLDKPPAELGRTVDSYPVEARVAAIGEYTDEPANPFAGTTDYHPPAASEMVIAGRYTLVEKIGEGGMGDVWVAKQIEPVKRKVALKLIKAGMDSKAVLQRFEQERQALAIMEHPNIARVIDGGMTAERRPFFVMELVHGLPLTSFCDEAKMGIRERLELFVSICHAVQHAHQKGIIHRDLKPSNILVTIIDGKPIPKVIDFGVAKATAGRLTDESLDTQFGSVVGTLDYMSPEQAGFSGVDIDTRADIYSLGVILYELLTGLRPIDANRLKKAAFTEMIRIIKEEEPSKPSTRLSTDDRAPSTAAMRQIEPKKLAALLRGELDWVVMKCLEKHRERRYETANGLARDIRRYLDDEVVEARPPSAGYRVRKFVSRHRGQVLAAGLLLVALLAGIAGTTWGLIREAKANADLSRSQSAVQARYDLAVDAIKTFHTGVSEDFLLKEDKFKDLRHRLLQSASDFYEKLGALLKDAGDLPSRRALLQANFELAELATMVGRKEDALALHRRVLAGRESLAASPGADPETRVDVARSLIAIGWDLEETGKHEEALAAYKKAQLTVSTTDGDAPEDAAARSAFADSLFRAGRMLNSLDLLKRAGDIQKVLALAEPKDNNRQFALTHTLDITAYVQNDMGKPAEAMASHEAALAIRRKLVEANPAVALYQSGLAWSYINIGLLLRDAGRTTEALASYNAALAIRRTLAEANPAVTRFQSELANSHLVMGYLLTKMGKPVEAMESYGSGLRVQQKLASDHPELPDFARDVGAAFNDMAVIDMEAKRFEEARVRLKQAVEWQRKALAANPANPSYRNYLIGHLMNLVGTARELRDSAGVAQAERELAAVRESDPAIKALDTRLSAIIKGDQTPNGRADRLLLAQHAYDKTLYAMAAKLWSDALNAEPKLGDDRQVQHRYNAACAAALAGSSKGKDDPAPDVAAKAKLREQALSWLKAELGAWTAMLASANEQQRGFVAQTLHHWKQDSDLAGVRDDASLAALPEPERAALAQLWNEVEGLLINVETAGSKSTRPPEPAGRQ